MVLSIKPEELYKRLSKKNDLILLDVRNPENYQTTRIETRHSPETINIPYYTFIDDEEKALQGVPKGKEIITVCNRGNSSALVADILERHQIRAYSLEGGMASWGNLYVSHIIAETGSYEIIQVDRPARGCLSYILISHGEAIIIDPSRHIDFYQRFISSKNVKLKAVFDTHAHADHISGGMALSEAASVPYYLHPYDGIHPLDMLPTKLPAYEMLKDGLTFALGELDFMVFHVPGHTLGQVSFLVKDKKAAHYLFSGDSLFIQSFGRPDLGGQGKVWAPLVYSSLFETIQAKVPGSALVLPGHYASPQEANDEGAFVMPLKDLFKYNKDLQITKDAFIHYVLDHLPTIPSQYQKIKRINLRLEQVTDTEASELELGKNICALASAYKT